MLKLAKCGFFILACFIFYNLAFAAEEPSEDLGKLVITKAKPHLSGVYSLSQDSLEDLPVDSPAEATKLLSLDLQGRSLRGGIQADFSLRGSTFQGVLVLLDGQRINDPQTAHHNFDLPLTCEDIARVEVLPGLSSSLFGPDAIGGAVNFQTKKPGSKKRVFEFSLGQFQSAYSLFSVSDKINSLGLSLSLENQNSGGFRDDTDFKKFTSTFNSCWEFPGGEMTTLFGYQEKEFGAYDFYTPNKGYPSKEWTKTCLFNTALTLNQSEVFFKPNFLWRRHWDKFMLDKTGLRNLSVNHHTSDVYLPTIYAQKETAVLGKLGMGLEYGQEIIDSTNLGGHNRRHKSIFIDDAKELTDKLSLSLASRRDDFDGSGEGYTGSLNLQYRLVPTAALNLGVAKSIRIPSFTELYYADSTTLGDVGLSAEKSLNYQLGLEVKQEKLHFSQTFFLRREEDFIDWVKRTPSQAKWQAENISQADVFGIESRLGFPLNKCLDLDTNYTYINKHSKGLGYLYKYGPNYTRHLSNVILYFHLPWGAQSIVLTYKQKPNRRGWLLLDTRLSLNLPKNSQAFLKITNLFNVEYQDIEGIPQAGRYLEAGLRWEW